MQFSIEQIRSVRENYRDPPYPGFSIDEVCRRRRMAQTKLVRGENAWSAKGTAQTTEEWVQRLVQGSLNKMSDRNFASVVAKLRTKELFATKEILTNVVAIMFQKALDEPENSKLYAAVCYELALYEVELSAEAKPKSELRNAIVHRAQREFKEFRRPEKDSDKNLREEEREFLRSNFMRRKKSNVRFVGELFLADVLATTSIFEISNIVMFAATEDRFPEEENIELFAEVCHTVGKHLDSKDKQRTMMDYYFRLLQGLLKKADNPYPHRIRFKIMDLLDLRKSAWGDKPKVVKAAPKKATAGGPSPSSPTAVKKGKTSEFSWRDKASKAASAKPAGGATVQPSDSLASRANDDKAAKEATATAAAEAAAAQRVVPFDRRAIGLFNEWVAACSNDFFPDWMNEFANCGRAFADEAELCVAVAREVLKEAAMTTRAEAQREACSFLIVGLYLMDKEMLRGFAGAVAAAVDDGLIEDVPRYPERLMNMVSLASSEEEINADVYYDAVNVLSMAYSQVEDANEDTVDTLMRFWSRVPKPDLDAPEDQRVILNFPVIYSLCEPEGAKPGVEKLISAIIDSLHSMGIVEGTTIQELLTTEVEANPLYGKIVTEYKMLKNL